MSSGPNTPTKAPKAMSSRLLTMKFMQRAAASSKPSSPSTSSPATAEQPSPKRRKTGDSSPVAFNVDSLADQRAIEAALAVEEAKRQAALERQAVEAGDTRWILNFETDSKSNSSKNTATSPLRVVRTGYATIDKVSLTSNYDNFADPPAVVGRRSFGRFNRVVEKLQDPDYESSDSDSSSDDEVKNAPDLDPSDNESFNETDMLIKEEQDQAAKKLKAERKAKRKSDKAELVRLAEKRKKKNVNLNDSSKLKSISSGGGSQGPDTRKCHNCGQVGHLAADCPKRRRRDQDGPYQ